MDENKAPLPAERRERQQTVSDVKIRKNGFGHSLYNLFIKNSIETARERVVTDILQPALTNMLIDSVNSVLNTIFRGGDSPSPYSGGYRNRYQSARDLRDRRPPREEPILSGKRFSASDYVIPDRKEAERTWVDLKEDFDEYGYIRVSDFLSCFGITPRPAEFNYGWRSFAGVRVSSVYGGYILTFPNPVSLN